MVFFAENTCCLMERKVRLHDYVSHISIHRFDASNTDCRRHYNCRGTGIAGIWRRNSILGYCRWYCQTDWEKKEVKAPSGAFIFCFRYI